MLKEKEREKDREREWSHRKRKMTYFSQDLFVLMSIWNKTRRGKHWMVHLLLLQQCIIQASTAGQCWCMFEKYIELNVYRVFRQKSIWTLVQKNIWMLLHNIQNIKVAKMMVQLFSGLHLSEPLFPLFLTWGHFPWMYNVRSSQETTSVANYFNYKHVLHVLQENIYCFIFWNL